MSAVAERVTQLPAEQSGYALMERVLLVGDLSKLSEKDRVMYYNSVCQSVGLNPLTRPFDYMNLNGKTVLYAKREATEQLRKIHGVSIEKLERATVEGCHIVTAYAKDKSGRMDSSTGAVNIGGLKGEAMANALMKAETKAKRRVTLSICGLGLLDETEVADAHAEASANFITPDQVKALQKLVTDSGADLAAFLTYLKIDALENLPAARFITAETALRAKLKAKDAPKEAP